MIEEELGPMEQRRRLAQFDRDESRQFMRGLGYAVLFSACFWGGIGGIWWTFII